MGYDTGLTLIHRDLLGGGRGGRGRVYVRDFRYLLQQHHRKR